MLKKHLIKRKEAKITKYEQNRNTAFPLVLFHKYLFSLTLFYFFCLVNFLSITKITHVICNKGKNPNKYKIYSYVKHSFILVETAFDRAIQEWIL